MARLAFEGRQGLHKNFIVLHARDGDKLVTVCIDGQALRDYGKGDSPLERYLNYPEQFQNVAAVKYNAGMVEADGSVRVWALDFELGAPTIARR